MDGSGSAATGSGNSGCVVETAQAAKLVLPAWMAGVMMVMLAIVIMVLKMAEMCRRGMRGGVPSHPPCLIVIRLRSNNAWPLFSFV
jgi:hypothetical protein